MTIKILGSGLPVVGYLKIGEAGEQGGKQRGAPVRWDHIELTGRQRDKDGRLYIDPFLTAKLIQSGVKTCGGCERAKHLAKVYDEPIFENGLPTELPIRLPYDDLELALPHRLAYYTGRTAFCVGDGEQAFRLEKVGDGYGPPQPFGPCGWGCPDLQSRKCKPTGKLRCVLEAQQSVGGCFEYHTTSWNSLRNLTESLHMIQAVTRGRLAWIPLRFAISPQTVQPKDGGRANVVMIASVTYPGSPQELLGAVKLQLELEEPLHAEIRQLGRGKTQWTETAEEIAAHQAEFAGVDGGDEEEDEEGQQALESARASESASEPAAAPPAPAAETPLTSDELAELNRAARARATDLFEAQATAQKPCAYATPADVAFALKLAALDAHGLRGGTLKANAPPLLLAYFARAYLDDQGKLALRDA